MTLVLEIREQENKTPTLNGAGVQIQFTPPVDEDYWSYRVRVSDGQAVVGFPKFGTIGIGFAVEEDWNTNLPYTSPTDKIVKHIEHNRGDAAIADGVIREAVWLIQRQAVADRLRERRERFNAVRQALESGAATATVRASGVAIDDALDMVHRSMSEAEMLAGEVDLLRQALAEIRAAVAELAPAPAVEVVLPEGFEWCTTWARRKRHISANLAERQGHPGARRMVAAPKGRAGRARCGARVLDADAVEHELSLWGSRKPFDAAVMAALEPCGLCLRGLNKGDEK